MRKRIKTMKTVIAALMLCGTALTPALAQNCTSPTRCSELGYIFSAEDCEGVRSLICPFDSSKYFCVETGDSAAGAQPGMILYSDGTVSNSVIPSKTPVGVVAYVDGSTRFAIALTEASTSFSTGFEDVSCLTNYGNSLSAQTDFSGATNTSCMINYNGSYSYLAAEYCNSYKPVSSGKGSSGWYLPAAGELYVTSFNYETINLGLQKLSKTQLSSNLYRSSTEKDNVYAWYVNPSDGTLNYAIYPVYNYQKDLSTRFRCVLAF